MIFPLDVKVPPLVRSNWSNLLTTSPSGRRRNCFNFSCKEVRDVIVQGDILCAMTPSAQPEQLSGRNSAAEQRGVGLFSGGSRPDWGNPSSLLTLVLSVNQIPELSASPVYRRFGSKNAFGLSERFTAAANLSRTRQPFQLIFKSYEKTQPNRSTSAKTSWLLAALHCVLRPRLVVGFSPVALRLNRRKIR